MFKWIEKKDLIYWLIIVLTTWLLNSNYHTTLSQWSFAGTIISIILAVLAIIYTFDQSSTTLHSTRKLEETSNEIRNITETLKDTSLNEFFHTLEQKIESLNKTFDESIKKNLKEYHDDIESIFYKGLSKYSKNDIEIFNEEEWVKYINNILSNITIPGLTLLYAYFVFRNKSKLSFYELSLYIVSRMDNNKIDNREQDDHILVLSSNLKGAFQIYVSLNVFEVSDEQNEIINVSDYFLAGIEKVIPTYQDTYYFKDVYDFVHKQNATT